MEPCRVDRLPGGLSVFSGGTRNVIKLDRRPWQIPLAVNPDACPFESEALDKAGRKITHRLEDWVSFPNLYTPNPNHHLIVPQTCRNWPDDRLRLLGNGWEITKALRLAEMIRDGSELPLWEVTVNVGYLGGQNVPHLHWHAFSPPEEALRGAPSPLPLAIELKNKTDRALQIYANEHLQVRVGGHRAGECVFLPRKKRSMTVEAIAQAIREVVALFAEKFRLTAGNGLAPDFSLILVYWRNSLAYGLYVPVLNHMASTEYAAMFGQQALTLPWPHELTVRYLRGEITAA